MESYRLKELGQELKEMREKKQLTQSELADEAGVTQQVISDIEEGIMNFKIETLFSITNALDCYAYFNIYQVEDDL